MKKIAIASLLAVAAFAASATEIAVGGVRDTTKNDVTGYTLSVGQSVTKDLSLKAGFENTVGVAGTNVDTYKFDATYNVTSVGPVSFAGVGSIGYTDVQKGNLKGSFVKFGPHASVNVPYVDGLSASIGLFRQLGTSAVNSLDKTEAVVGVKYKLTQSISVNGSATFYDNVPGSKMRMNVAYTF